MKKVTGSKTAEAKTGTEVVVAIAPETKAPEKVTKPRVRRKVNAKQVKRLETSASQAVAKAVEKDKANDKPVLPTNEREALEGIKALQVTIKKGTAVEGLSPLGHMAGKQNGQLDIALLTGKGVNFTEWVTAVQKANCESRRSDLDDDKTFVKWLQSHLKFCSGRKHSGQVNMPKRLAKVGLGAESKKIMKMMEPVSILFDEYVANGTF